MMPNPYTNEGTCTRSFVNSDPPRVLPWKASCDSSKQVTRTLLRTGMSVSHTRRVEMHSHQRASSSTNAQEAVSFSPASAIKREGSWTLLPYRVAFVLGRDNRNMRAALVEAT